MSLKCLNRNQVKYLLILAMLIDHIAGSFVPTLSVAGQLMHFFGRLTGPAMSVLLAEGYQYTKDKKKYALRLFIFALISWVPFSLRRTGSFPYPVLGMIFTLFLGFITIWMWDKLKVPKAVKIIFVILLCALSIFGDWALFSVLWVFFAYIYRDKPIAKWVSFMIIAVCEVALSMLMGGVVSNLYQIGVFMVPILLICFYNGEKGSSAKFHKWFFYVFYPLHQLIIFLLKAFVFK